MDEEELNFTIKPIYLEPEDHIMELGASLLILNDEIEKLDIDTKELFSRLYNQMNNLYDL